MTNRRIARRASAAAAPLLAVGLLAGCAEELPVPEPEPAVVGAVVTEEQEKTIISRVAESVETATKGRKTGALEERMAGPALTVRTSQIEVARKIKSDEQVTNLPMSMQSVMLPSDPEWPRTSLAVSTQPKDLTAPVLYAFEQRSARSDYKLWAWARLLPGVTLPQFASTDTGTEEVAADDGESLTMSPARAVAAYADVLSEEDDSKFAKRIEDDDFRDLMRKQESAQKKADGWKKSEGKYSFSATADEDEGVQAMRTVDGGAIVLGAINSSQVIQLQDKAEAPPSDGFVTQKALFGDQDVTNVLRTKYLDVVALYVPPAGSDDKLRLVGFEHIAVSATNE
ncbi:hypothetical protein [Myceligenerans pegani]|uniref:DUF8094 domain-containing protein n=1 Tax=Myceligenerans pegani TaxID=2776917 RepID=A0ABR9MY35_9MICO|nr:hypothetical protein [Myceligenerans sp. TRM 65318]MBE1875931.1 hypothetical protein [Myceligenerans sp. TRM 65318]MBE3018202.1 hypothetical protein [Myceligenerans sp. TRM 65318]